MPGGLQNRFFSNNAEAEKAKAKRERVYDTSRGHKTRRLQGLFGTSRFVSSEQGAALRQGYRGRASMRERAATSEDLFDIYISGQRDTIHKEDKETLDLIDTATDEGKRKALSKHPKGVFRWLFNRGKKTGTAGHEHELDVGKGIEYYMNPSLRDADFSEFNPFDDIGSDPANQPARTGDNARLTNAMNAQIDEMGFQIQHYDTNKNLQDTGLRYSKQELAKHYDEDDSDRTGKVSSKQKFKMDDEEDVPEPYYELEDIIDDKNPGAGPDEIDDMVKEAKRNVTHQFEMVINMPNEAYEITQKSKITGTKIPYRLPAGTRKPVINQHRQLVQIKKSPTYKTLKSKRSKDKGFKEETDPVLLSYIFEQQEVMSFEDEGEYNPSGYHGHAFFRLKQRYEDKLLGQYSFGFHNANYGSTDVATGLVMNPDEKSWVGNIGENESLGEKNISEQSELSAVGFVRSVIGSGRSYSFEGYNCTSFAVEGAKAAGLSYNGRTTMMGKTSRSTDYDTPVALARNSGVFARKAEQIERDVDMEQVDLIHNIKNNPARKGSSLYRKLYNSVYTYTNYDPNDILIDQFILRVYDLIIRKFNECYPEPNDLTKNTRLRNILTDYRATYDFYMSKLYVPTSADKAYDKYAHIDRDGYDVAQEVDDKFLIMGAKEIIRSDDSGELKTLATSFLADASPDSASLPAAKIKVLKDAKPSTPSQDIIDSWVGATERLFGAAETGLSDEDTKTLVIDFLETKMRVDGEDLDDYEDADPDDMDDLIKGLGVAIAYSMQAVGSTINTTHISNIATRTNLYNALMMENIVYNVNGLLALLYEDSDELDKYAERPTTLAAKAAATVAVVAPPAPPVDYRAEVVDFLKDRYGLEDGALSDMSGFFMSDIFMDCMTVSMQALNLEDKKQYKLLVDALSFVTENNNIDIKNISADKAGDLGGLADELRGNSTEIAYFTRSWLDNQDNETP